ncbi:MAG: helix-turn-helix domain-containing protein [Geminicoccaceae bacterium]
MKPRQYFSEQQKRAAIDRLVAGETPAQVAQDIGADRRRLYEWYQKYQELGFDGLRRVGRPRKRGAGARSWREAPDEKEAARRQHAELERKIGQQQVDLDFFRRALRLIEETRQARSRSGASVSTRSSRK